MDGLLSGGKSIANGLEKGITGVVTKPLEGAKKSGVGGFFVGGLKGLAGLAVKPVTGIIDATSKTSEGIKNNANIMNPGERLALMRTHNPRPFYHICR